MVRNYELHKISSALDEVVDDIVQAEGLLAQFAAHLSLPNLVWSPDVSRPVYNADVAGFLLRHGWPSELVDKWWEKHIMLKTPLYIRCRSQAVPFASEVGKQFSESTKELRAVQDIMRDMNLNSLLTIPIHRPFGQVSMITLGGSLDIESTQQIADSSKGLLTAVGQQFTNIYQAAQGSNEVSSAARTTFTTREWECLRLTALGHTESKTAELLGVGASTVKFHVRNATRKLDASNRTHAIAKAAQLGLLGQLDI